MSRVSDLKREVANGTYHVDPGRVAEAMIRLGEARLDGDGFHASEKAYRLNCAKARIARRFPRVVTA